MNKLDLNQLCEGSGSIAIFVQRSFVPFYIVGRYKNGHDLLDIQHEPYNPYLGCWSTSGSPN